MILSSNIKDFIEKHEHDDIYKLALQSKLYPDIDIPFAVSQISGRKIAKEKIPSWYKNQDILYPLHLSIEQSSSEQTALYKASLCEGDTMVDLTGGFGVDFFFISQKFRKAIYVEQQKELAEIVSHNTKVVRSNNTEIINADSVEYLSSMQPVDFIYIDPARRSDSGKKTVRIEDCTPNILEIAGLLEEKSKFTMIKLSPMLDISLALQSLKNISDIHIVSVQNECKELLFVKKRDTLSVVKIHAVNLQKDKKDIFSLTLEEEKETDIIYTSEIKKYLYEPNSSILKGGAYKSIAIAFGIEKFHPSSHLYTSDDLNTDFPGRIFEINNVCSLNKKEIKKYLPYTTQANITTRNFPLSVKEIRKKTGLKEGGESYIFATTLANEKKVLLICKKID